MKHLKPILTLVFAVVLSVSMFAQTDPPDPPDGHGDPENQDGGGDAPVGAGVFILLGLGAAYGAGKTYFLGREKEIFDL